MKITDYIVTYGVGFFFSVVVGHWVTTRVVERLHEKPGPRREENYERLPKITGMLDRFLYTGAWLTPYREFIGIWLLVKVAKSWKVPGEPLKQTSERKKVKGQWVVSGYEVGRYNIFIIGNALCVIFGVLGGVIIKLIIKHWDAIIAFIWR